MIKMSFVQIQGPQLSWESEFVWYSLSRNEKIYVIDLEVTYQATIGLQV